jgi:hypothetical protein
VPDPVRFADGDRQRCLDHARTLTAAPFKIVRDLTHQHARLRRGVLRTNVANDLAQ